MHAQLVLELTGKSWLKLDRINADAVILKSGERLTVY
jgi:hypothetical protein